ncbi:glycosyl hydrolase family 28-related protein, partial [Bacteroides sp.]|uniref:right-handed parallel beta-helix repeat-containing protein n=1 Tax=Bacteroides sp. TaxID=29523 RepID=UPI002632506A
MIIVKQSGTPVTGKVYIGNTHTAIQNAINYANSQSGGVVFIEKGVYTISTPLEMYSDIELCGEGIHTVLKSAVAASGTNAVIRCVGTSSVKKKNMYIHDLLIGNNTDTAVGYYGIYCQHVGLAQTTGLTSETYSRYNSATVGVTGENIIGVTIENCVIQYNNNISIRLDPSNHNNTITGNTIQNNNGNGISLDSSNNNTITGNTVQNNNNYGIRLESSSNNNTITG